MKAQGPVGIASYLKLRRSGVARVPEIVVEGTGKSPRVTTPASPLTVVVASQLEMTEGSRQTRWNALWSRAREIGLRSA